MMREFARYLLLCAALIGCISVGAIIGRDSLNDDIIKNCNEFKMISIKGNVYSCIKREG